MDVVFYAAGIIVLVIVAGCAVGALLASAQAGRKRREELENRYIANQPWDAQSR